MLNNEKNHYLQPNIEEIIRLHDLSASPATNYCINHPILGFMPIVVDLLDLSINQQRDLDLQIYKYARQEHVLGDMRSTAFIKIGDSINENHLKTSTTSSSEEIQSAQLRFIQNNAVLMGLERQVEEGLLSIDPHTSTLLIDGECPLLTNTSVYMIKLLSLKGVDFDLLNYSQVMDLVEIHSESLNIIINPSLNIKKEYQNVRSVVGGIVKDKLSTVLLKMVNNDEFITELESLLQVLNFLRIDLSESHLTFRSIVEAGKELTGELRDEFIQVLRKNSIGLYEAYYVNYKKDTSITDPDRLFWNFIGLSSDEVNNIVQVNFSKISIFMKELQDNHYSFVFTKEILEQIYSISTANLMPPYANGFRTNNNTRFNPADTVEIDDLKYSDTISTSKKELDRELDIFLEDVNALLNLDISNYIFEIKVAGLAAKYAKMHPFYDGQGRNNILFMEACMMARGSKYDHIELYKNNFYKRINQVLRGNIIAKLNLILSYTGSKRDIVDQAYRYFKAKY